MIGSVDINGCCLILSTLLSYVNKTIEQIPDPRKPSNAKVHSFADIVLSGFAVFFMQCNSFLEYQRQVQQQQGKDNAQKFFGIERIPSDNHIRKTKGYALEHNFGHGQQHLSQVLLTLNLLAFLFHTVLHLADEA